MVNNMLDRLQEIKEKVLNVFTSKKHYEIGNTLKEIDYLIATLKYKVDENFTIIDLESCCSYEDFKTIYDMTQSEKDINYLLVNEDNTIKIIVNFQCDAYYNAYKINAILKGA